MNNFTIIHSYKNEEDLMLSDIIAENVSEDDAYDYCDSKNYELSLRGIPGSIACYFYY